MNKNELEQKLNKKFKEVDISVIFYPKHTGKEIGYRKLDKEAVEDIAAKIEISFLNHSFFLDEIGISKIENFDESDFEKICQEIKVSIG